MLKARIAKLEYFESDKIDPTMEFDFIENVQLGDIVVTVPVPKGYEFKLLAENREEIIGFNFSNDSEPFFFLIHDIQPFRNELSFFREIDEHLSAIQTIEYENQIANFFYSLFETKILVSDIPTLVQLTSNSIISYAFVNALEANESGRGSGFVSGLLLFDQSFFKFSGFGIKDSKLTSEIILVTWLNSFLFRNSTGR